MSGPPLPLLVIGGPTGTGKTRLAVEVAREVGGEIISADAFQIYRGLAIGTAQPTAEERAEVPFHLVAEIEPTEPFTVADFMARAQTAIADIAARGRLPILCGGTGLYVRALLRHFSFPPAPGPEGREIRARLEREAEASGPRLLYERLIQVDPLYAARIAPTDARRLIRALEVWELTGAPVSSQSGVDPSPAVRYNNATYLLTCPREMLRRRLEERISQMLAAGWLEEVRGLREAGLTPGLPALRALGYAELFTVLEGRLTLEEAAAAISLATRKYAKRQFTWFRRDPGTWMTWDSPAEFDLFRRHLVRVAGWLRSADRLEKGPWNSLSSTD
jgi:tRNA dimethylallyltransferase